MQQFILHALNRNFRPAGPASISLFPRDEFDEREAAKLKLFCDTLCTTGYDELFDLKDTKNIRDILDLAAGYGSFVSKEAAPWYLGIFIAAECLMEPYGSDSFYDQMLRSEVFAESASDWKNQALWLMLMALFCDRLDTTAARVELFVQSCSELGYSLKNLTIESFLQLTPNPKEN